MRTKGFQARVEAVAQPRAVDVPPGVLGYRVRVGSYPTKDAANAVGAQITAAGELVSAVYTGWDGDRAARGPWHVEVVTIDPPTFRGSLDASYGSDFVNRETTSALTRAAGATVGINAGFFVLDPASGAPGDPAGVGFYDGRLLSEPVNGRPALVLHHNARATSVERLWWKGSVTAGRSTWPLDGINRFPGMIRSCGGDATDTPTSAPLHDVTCKDDSELVTFTTAFGPSTPAGPGAEVVLDRAGQVVSSNGSRGVALAADTTSVQATGSFAAKLQHVHVGDRLNLRTGLVNQSGRAVLPGRDTTLVNGGPLLVTGGREHITQAQDGMAHPGDPSFDYGWVVKRNPRTFAGVDALGRTVLVTVDGRSTTDLGLSIPETADVARSLGLVEAINLDGGGSTAMALGGKLITHPSDGTERPVGDGIVVTPRR